MIELGNKAACCGCEACVQCCPQRCILFKIDKEGFGYPLIDKEKCVDCGLCDKVCPIINQNNARIPLKVYAAINPNEQVRKDSSSGGVFALLAEYIINEGGIVFGVRFNRTWGVVHDWVDSIENISYFRGSKYVQSKIGDVFKKTKEFLKSGRKVLFSGTPCQIAGLKLYLKKDYENLLTVDFICHGVPSPKVWQMYLDEIIANWEKKETVPSCFVGKKNICIERVQFRDKCLGWKKFSFTLTLSRISENGKKETFLFSESLHDNIFLKGFLKDLYLRPSCSVCSTKSLKSGSDMTIADFWGIGNVIPEIDDDKGVSLVLINTNKASVLLKKLDVAVLEANYEDVLRYNPSIITSVVPHKKRNVFFKKIDESRFVSSLILRYTRVSLYEQVKRKVKNALMLILKCKYYFPDS